MSEYLRDSGHHDMRTCDSCGGAFHCAAYLGHVSGGMVRVRLRDGTEDIMDPRCFAVLR